MEPRFFADRQARIAVELISGRWPMVVLYALGDGPARPGELLKQIGGISQKVLTETLRRLEYNGLVERRFPVGRKETVKGSRDSAGVRLIPSRRFGHVQSQSGHRRATG